MSRCTKMLMSSLGAALLAVLGACTASDSQAPVAASQARSAASPAATAATDPGAPAPHHNALVKAKAGFQTRLVSDGVAAGAAERPPSALLDRIHFAAADGDLVAYLTPDPGDGQRHPAIIWITGGDNNSIGDVWTPAPTNNDQTAAGFRDAGMVMMFPSQRGGNDNPGRREGFLGEVDDVLAAHQYLARLPYVDAGRIYLGGHSTGGTLAMLVAESTDVFAATFAFGPVAAAAHYDGSFVYCDPADRAEMALRSPLFWLNEVRRPLYVVEGAERGNWASIALLVEQNRNPNIQFHQIPGHDHFSVLHPVITRLARAIVTDSGRIDRAVFELDA